MGERKAEGSGGCVCGGRYYPPGVDPPLTNCVLDAWPDRAQGTGDPCPLVYPHQGSGQPGSCLESLVRYAQQQAESPELPYFASGEDFAAWSWSLPVVYDQGEGPTVPGCDPVQRSRGWREVVDGGANCWEVTGLYIAAAIRACAPIEIHVYDATVNGQRHVFPAVRDRGERTQPEAVVLQPPVVAQGLVRRGQRIRAQGLAGLWGRGRAQHFYQQLAAQGFADVGESVYTFLEPTGITHLSDPSVFDAPYYLARYADLRTKFGADHAAARHHWLVAGIAEGRQASPGFDVRYYLATNPDLQEAIGDDYYAAVRHWLSAGRDEGRRGARPAQGLRANEWYNDLLGVTHVAGKSVLGVFGVPQVGDALEEVEADVLPDYAKSEQRLARERESEQREGMTAVQRYKADQAAEAARRETTQPTSSGPIKTRCRCDNEGASKWAA